MRVKELIIILFAIMFLFFIIFSLGGNNSSFDGEILGEKISSDGYYKAIKFKNSAGATTRFSYNLAILTDNENLTSDSHVVFTSYGDFDYYWSKGELTIVTKNDERIFNQEKKYLDINILYSAN